MSDGAVSPAEDYRIHETLNAFGLKEHPAASLFPLLRGEEYRDLVEDIRANGLQHPITVMASEVLDGRNRLRACRDLGVQPRIEEWAPENGVSPSQWVISTNLHRRHLTPSQRATIAVDLLPMLEAEARERQLATLKKGDVAPVVEKLPQRDGSKSRDDAGKALGVSGRYVSEAKRLKEEAPEVFEEVRAGEKTISAAKKELGGAKLAVHHSSETGEWYTPADILDAVVRAMGGIDLDPCSNPGEPVVPASKHFTLADDGLGMKWRGRVYMNPPYGRGIADWVRKLRSEFEGGGVSEAVALLPARTDTAWMWELRQYPRCFVRGRINFSDHQNAAPFPSCVVYLGPSPERFAEAFRGHGDTYVLFGG